MIEADQGILHQIGSINQSAYVGIFLTNPIEMTRQWSVSGRTKALTDKSDFLQKKRKPFNKTKR